MNDSTRTVVFFILVSVILFTWNISIAIDYILSLRNAVQKGCRLEFQHPISDQIFPHQMIWQVWKMMLSDTYSIINPTMNKKLR